MPCCRGLPSSWSWGLNSVFSPGSPLVRETREERGGEERREGGTGEEASRRKEWCKGVGLEQSVKAWISVHWKLTLAYVPQYTCVYTSSMYMHPGHQGIIYHSAMQNITLQNRHDTLYMDCVWEPCVPSCIMHMHCNFLHLDGSRLTQVLLMYDDSCQYCTLVILADSCT